MCKKIDEMIRCNVKVSGVVSQAATNRTNGEGKPFTAFTLKVVIPAKSGINKTMYVSVIKDGTCEELTSVQIGERLEVSGTMTLKKRGDIFYLNLSASEVNLSVSEDKDVIEGDLQFRGKIGKSIDEKTDKKGNPYIQFSAYSSEKVDDGFEHTWVRFIRFGKAKEEWLVPEMKIEAKGALELSVYNDHLNISCRAEDITEYVSPSNNNQD